MYCDIDGPSFYRDQVVKARKEHKCCECRAPILKGESYLDISGKWEGSFDTFKQHLLCRDACVFIRDRFQDGDCIPFGWLPQYLLDSVIGKKNPEDREFRSIIAKIIWRERKWKRHN